MKSFMERQAKREEERKATQEQKNDYDFIYETNQSIQNLNISFGALKQDLVLHISKLSSDMKYQDIRIEKVEEKNNLHRMSCDNSLNQFGKKLDECLDAFQKKYQSDMLNSVSMDSLTKSIQTIKSDFLELDHQQNRIENLITTEVRRICKIMDEKSDSLKKEIESTPSEIPALKQSISDEMSIYKVNFDGLIREIEIIKKKAFLNQKHIEDLYTKMDRLRQETQ